MYEFSCACGDYGIWQHSCKGKIDGISGDVDLDKCYVDYPQKIKAKGLNGFRVTPIPVLDDSVSVEVAVDGKKYSSSRCRDCSLHPSQNRTCAIYAYGSSFHIYTCP